MIVHHYHKLKHLCLHQLFHGHSVTPFEYLTLRFWYVNSGMSILVCQFWYVNSGMSILVCQFWYTGRNKSGKIWLGSFLETPPGCSSQVFYTSVYDLHLLCILVFLPLSFDNTQLPQY